MRPAILTIMFAYSTGTALFLGLALKDISHAAIFCLLAGGFLGVRLALHDRGDFA